MKKLIVRKGAMLLVIAALLMSVIATPAAAYASSSEAFTSRADASAYYLQQLKNHASTIKFDFVTTNGNGSEVSKYFINDAFNDNASDPNLLGDYIHYGVYNGYNVKYSYYQSGGKYHYTFTYTMSYKMTASQDQTFENKLNSVMKSLNLSGKSEYAKVKAIYDYITKNVKYDKTHGSTYYQKYTAYAALCNKSAVCQGYADLFYRMCKKAGLSVRIVTGTSRNEGHAWNIVKIGSKFYNVDATWDAGKSSYSYFLKSNANFKDHKRNDTYSTSSFNSACPMSSSSYYAINYKKAKVKTKKASKTSIKVTWSKVSGADGYYVYRATGKGKYKKVATIKGNKTSYTNKKLKKGKTYKYKVKAYEKVGSSKTYSKTSKVASRKL